ncbi:MAG: hypothetical protein C0467_22705 [Planctomycetaceae bacterium]|nr:hypothetical protein [Planctomycetaceae bacterium]
MKLLTCAAAIEAELTRLIGECRSCQVAVAWASVGFEAFDLVRGQKNKIKRMVVGTHFYQTHPDFIETFLTHPNVRFVLNPSGVFHPKAYLFEMAGSKWECVVGSPNFTQAAFGGNDEMAVLMTNGDVGAASAFGDLQQAIDQYWEKATVLTPGELAGYRDMWKRKQPALRNVLGQYGNPQQETEGDKGKSPVNVPLLRMSWDEFFKQVKSEIDHPPHDHSLEGRLKVMRAVKKIFADHKEFQNVDDAGREHIAGLANSGDVFFLWFGSMREVGKFWTAIQSNDKNLSVALDQIPATGAITREQYLEYIKHYLKAFPEGRHGVPTASRLLAMKRPDTFVCFNKRNLEGLCTAFGISHKIGYEYEGYWDSIIGRIKDSTWWNSPLPTDDSEREVWQYRAAFLDSLYYDGKDMPSA